MITVNLMYLRIGELIRQSSATNQKFSNQFVGIIITVGKSQKTQFHKMVL